MRLRDLRTLDGEVNARFMPPQEWTQLIANIRHDGGLTSAPLVARGGDDPLTTDGGDRLEVISGNHRVLAAIEAGIEEADVLEITTPISAERKRAIQLAHNRIAGRDDPNTLQKLYESLGLQARIYSALSDEDFKLPELDLGSLSVGGLKYQEIVLGFLPAEVEQFERFLERCRAAPKATAYLAPIEAFAGFFDLVTKIKAKRRIVNTAIAVCLLLQYASERMDQIESEEQ